MGNYRKVLDLEKMANIFCVFFEAPKRCKYQITQNEKTSFKVNKIRLYYRLYRLY